jgi:hypothetical protein
VNEWPKIVGDFGLSCFVLLLLWKTLDKWAGEFLVAHKQQAAAMTMLAESVKQSMSDSREILIAVRVQSQQIADVKRLLEEGRGR